MYMQTLWVTMFHPSVVPQAVLWWSSRKEPVAMNVDPDFFSRNCMASRVSCQPSISACVAKYQILFVDFPKIIAIVCELLILLVSESQIVGSVPFALGTTTFVGHIIKIQCLLANPAPLAGSGRPKLDGGIDQTCSTSLHCRHWKKPFSFAMRVGVSWLCLVLELSWNCP